MGKALELWYEKSNETTLFSLLLEQTEIKAFFTYSEIKEFASKVFLINFVKITSNSESKFFLWLFDN